MILMEVQYMILMRVWYNFWWKHSTVPMEVQYNTEEVQYNFDGSKVWKFEEWIFFANDACGCKECWTSVDDCHDDDVHFDEQGDYEDTYDEYDDDDNDHDDEEKSNGNEWWWQIEHRRQLTLAVLARNVEGPQDFPRFSPGPQISVKFLTKLSFPVFSLGFSGIFVTVHIFTCGSGLGIFDKAVISCCPT